MPRSSRFWLWHVPATLATVAGVVFAAGFWLALAGGAGAPLGEPPPPLAQREASRPAGKRLVLVLGDSLSHGTGDPTGNGYATDVADFLKRRGPVELVNLAVAGAESSDLRELVGSANVRSLASSANLILLSIGGNDLSHALGGAGAPGEALSAVAATRARLAGNLRAILSELRAANPSAPIRVLLLYQPFSGDGREIRVGASLVLAWSGLISETTLAFSNVAAIPVFDLFQGRPDRLASDRFHPNRDGYRVIADRVIQTLPREL
ncbi:MAG TPA: GDSL-type esterase/lipase family protein [Thermoanaerobaculia bacterium]